MNDVAQTQTTEPVAPWPALEVAEHATKQHQLLQHAHLVHEALPIVGGRLRAEDQRVTANLAALDAGPPPAGLPLDDELVLRQEQYRATEDRLAGLQQNKVAIVKEQGRLTVALREAEAAIEQAATDERQSARSFASGGTTALLAARARGERARAEAEQVRRDLDALAQAEGVVNRDLQATGDERHRRAQALWRAVSRREFEQAGAGIRHLARSWAARSKAGDQSLTMQQFVSMAFAQAMPGIEAQAALERALRAEFFPTAE